LSLLGVSAAVAGCGAVGNQPVWERTPPSASRALPGPAPRGRSAESAAKLNHACEGCHQTIAAEWRTSFHACSQTDVAYQRAFAIEPLEFCQGCHAPETDPRAPVPAAAAEIGVGCVTCHVVGTDVLAGPDHPHPSSPPHLVLRDARLAGASACAACHEFAFPDRGARARPELMQATLSEHLKSEQSSTDCASCHMPTTTYGGVAHRSHAFAGGHDAELVRSAVAVTAERSPHGARITLTPRQLGHAFPTGDLFRRVEVSAEVLGREWQVITSASRYLARHWQRQPSPFGVVLRSATRDDRPLGEPQVIELELGPQAAELPIHWRVAYQRVEHPRSDREQDESVEGEIEILSGALEKNP
jgi:Cytochrome c554 and c-prime